MSQKYHVKFDKTPINMTANEAKKGFFNGKLLKIDDCEGKKYLCFLDTTNNKPVELALVDISYMGEI